METELLNETRKCGLCGFHIPVEEYVQSNNICDFCYERKLDTYDGSYDVFAYECKVCHTQYDITEGGNIERCPECDKINLERI